MTVPPVQAVATTPAVHVGREEGNKGWGHTCEYQDRARNQNDLHTAEQVSAFTLLNVVGAAGTTATAAPLAPWLKAPRPGQGPVVRIGAAIAALGALLALIAGLGRTTLAMARQDDLPAWLAAVHPRYKVPHRAEISLGTLICLIILIADLRGAIGFSSFGVLIYYLIANIGARAGS